jgi:signal transduction histidine kinase
MRVIDILEEIKPVWVSRVSQNLARGESVREKFLEQLHIFFDLLNQSLITGDPSWMNNVLDAWAESRTQSDSKEQETSIIKILDTILFTTVEIAQEILKSADGLNLISSLIPIYVYAFNYITRLETQRYIDHISRDLEKAQSNLENLDKNKSDFIAVAAHELKTPLTLIEGYASMLKDLFPNDVIDSGTIILQGMDNGIRRLEDIINDMIDVSLIDNDMLKINFQPVWIRQLLEIARRDLSRHVKERSQTFNVLEFDGCEEMTYGDQERLIQALRNIITNAIKYTPDGGRITVGGRKLPGFVEITVTDTGIGIDEAFHEEIFEKFGRLGNVQLHSSGKTKFKGGGPGLGLPITKGLIEAHGGAIWVESEGHDEINCPGTTFHIILPIIAEPPDKKMAKLFQPLSDLNVSNKQVVHITNSDLDN